MSGNYPEQTIGEIQRPLIFKLKSRFALKELVAQRMHVGACVYPIFDVDVLLGVGRIIAAVVAGTGAAGTYATGATVPQGKRWRLRGMSLWQTTAIAASQCCGAIRQLAGGSANMPLTIGTGAGLAFSPAVSSFTDAMILEPGDDFGLEVMVTGAASSYTVFAEVLEEDFRENVV